MSDYIVFVVTSVAILIVLSVCLSRVIKGDIEADMEFIKSNVKSFWELIDTHADELDTLRARIYDLETKVNEIAKEMEKLNDGK